MKRTLSILLVAMLVISVAATAFAANTANNIVLGTDKDSGLALSDSLLKPGESYLFPVSVAINGEAATPLTQAILDNYSFKISNTGKGNSLTEYTLTKIGGVEYISVKVKAGWPATTTEEEYTMKLTNRSDSKDYVEVTVMFETGYATMSSDYVEALAKEDEIVVNNDTPVFTESQLEKIAKLNGYKKVVFSGDNWTYTTNVSGMKSINMLNNNTAISEILAKYESNSFEFLTFPAGTKFSTNGTVEINASGFAEEFGEKFFVYRYLDGKLTAITSSYDADDEVLSFTTNTLGRFVITDKAISDAVVVTPSNPTTPSVPSNPNTGAAI